jgi:demethylmenaquinone methyltransferase / 2-methoxy-6-polyprenyl-1,4-benzoquinol methylase
VVTNSQQPAKDPARIREMFRSISGRYDRANTVLSAGIHHRWRARAVRASNVRKGDSVLDCATGTGDLAIAFRKAVGDSGRVVGTDFVAEMLEIARVKAPGIEFEVADVTKLPYADSSFDVASISFGIRNVNDPGRAISEMTRVLRPGGRLIVLEFGQPRSRAFGALYDWYRKTVLPRVGGAITGRREAYEYLEASAGVFPCGEDFVRLMRENASFSSIDATPLTFGIAWLYRGVKS